MRYDPNAGWIKYATPGIKSLLLGGCAALFTVLTYWLYLLSIRSTVDITTIRMLIDRSTPILYKTCRISAVIVIVCLLYALIFKLTFTPAKQIQYLVIKKIGLPELGNPLGLKDGEVLPRVKCHEKSNGIYKLVISAASTSIEELINLSPEISTCLNTKKMCRYAVTQHTADIALNQVTYIIEDVTVHHELVVENVSDLKSDKVTRIKIQDNTSIDLKSSGSILMAGKTRSGKSTAVISMLLQVLSHGRDKNGSEVLIIDPKQAELSRLPHVVTLDVDGEARDILQAIQAYADSITKRQARLNALSERKGDAVKWWTAKMHPSFLFIDEYVAARTIFPKKPEKGDEAYCLATFDGLIKRIVTMGASAGCYVIISIAEASVEEGGLPSMIKSALTTKILMKPTLTEGRLIWDSEKIKDLAQRTYTSGDAWFSSTDGIHESVSYVHFPVMKFKVYRELGRLLKAYYNTAPPPERSDGRRRGR